MRAVLRVEVEAVKFLKEEPHKLDSMLKRVKSLTDTLSSLRRCATEVSANGSVKPAPRSHTSTTSTSTPSVLPEAPRETPSLAASPPGQKEAVVGPLPTAGPLPAPRPQRKVPPPLVMVQQVQSAPVFMQHSQTSGTLMGAPADPPAPLGPQARDPEPARRHPGGLLNNGASRQDMVIEELQSSQ
ncbi:hypothetical protein CRUP_032639, partial [Coryphaenoides rupestris]